MGRTCEEPSCDSRHVANGMCSYHYHRAKREAAKLQACKVDGCESPVSQQGMCSSHHHRWHRHGDVFAGRTPQGEPLAWLRAVTAIAEPGECIITPYGTDKAGYGHLVYEGRKLRMHQVVLILTGRGLPPEGMETRHLCGNSGCVNPHHLLVGTPKENGEDRVVHGTATHPRGEVHPRAVLTEADVRTIRASSESNAHWGRVFGISAVAVQHARSGRTWGHLPEVAVPRSTGGGKGPTTRLTDSDVREIRASDLSNAHWVGVFGLSLSTIQQVRSGKLYSRIPDVAVPRKRGPRRGE